MVLLDTNILVFLQDRREETVRRVLESDDLPAISLISVIELEGGIAADPAEAAGRREALDRLQHSFTTLPFDQQVVDAYARILASTGFSRARILDRLIAATAIVHDLTLVTSNGPDFAGIPDLRLEVWPRPAQ